MRFGSAFIGGLLCCWIFVLPAKGSSPRRSDNKREPAYEKSQDDRSQSPAVVNAGRPKRSLKERIPDLVLLNQDGKKVNFYSDLIKGKIVIISYFFTSCRLICPMQGEAFARLQSALGDRLGKDVFLISITSDPIADTPERLKAWGAQFGAKPGWTLLTGDQKTVHSLLVLLTGAIPGTSEHRAIIFILNDETGAWLREYGMTAPERVLKEIDKTKEK